MKQMVILAALVAAASFLGLLPFENGDISDFCPVEILCVERAEGGVRIRADEGIGAVGETVPEALRLLAEAAPGRLLLDTVDYVVFREIDPNAAELMDCGLRPATCIYYTARKIEKPEALAVYLREHKKSTTLGELEEHEKARIPMIVRMESGFLLEGST